MKTAVVTGAAGAIGSTICLRLLDRGYRVVAVDRDSAGLRRLPRHVMAVTADLSDLTAGGIITAAIETAGGRCDLLVHSAGVVVTGPVGLAEPEKLRQEQSVNLLGPIILTQALYPKLQQVGGQVITIASLASMLPLAESPGYSASKAGIRAFMLALSLRTPETGVHISLIHPGAVDTPMLRHEAANGGSALNFLGTPLSPERVADAVLDNLDKPRLETSLPRYGGCAVRLLGLFPATLEYVRPLFERMAGSRMQQYRRNNPPESSC